MATYTGMYICMHVFIEASISQYIENDVREMAWLYVCVHECLHRARVIQTHTHVYTRICTYNVCVILYIYIHTHTYGLSDYMYVNAMCMKVFLCLSVSVM